MKQLSDRTPAVAGSLGVSYIGLMLLVFSPTLFVTWVFTGVPGVVLATTPTLILIVLTVGVSLAHARTDNPFTTWLFSRTTSLVDRTSHPKQWRQSLRWQAGFFLAGVILAGVITGAGWWTILFVITTVVNFLLIGGKFKPTPSVGDLEETGDITTEKLARATVDFFSPAADYKIKPADGVAYIDEDARLRNARASILSITQPSPGQYKVQFRNLTGRPDTDFVAFFPGVASQLGLHDYNLRPRDPQYGFIVLELWVVERTDATDTVHGLLLYIPAITEGEGI